MDLTVTEWRKLILQFFVAGGRFYFVCSKERLFEEFASHKDENLFIAFQSLLKDGKLSVYPTNGKMLYGWNYSKVTEINDEIFRHTDVDKIEVIQPFDKNFTDMSYEFESETNRNLPNKGKYYHFTKNADNSFWVSIVKTKGSFKSNKLVLGSLNDPKSRISRIYKAIEKVTRDKAEDLFIKKNIEDIEPKACGNSRQYSRAALDVLEHLNLIRAITSSGRSPIYAITNSNKERNTTLDEIFERIFDEQALTKKQEDKDKET
jgi:hypothetical protein